MLVHSYETYQTFNFPHVGTSVEVYRADGIPIQVIVDAPSDEQILSGGPATHCELAGTGAGEVNQKDWRHKLRNKLHAVSLATEVLQRQLEEERFEDAERTLKMALESLEELDHVASKRPMHPMARQDRELAQCA